MNIYNLANHLWQANSLHPHLWQGKHYEFWSRLVCIFMYANAGRLQIQPNRFPADFQNTFNKVPGDLYIDQASEVLQYKI